MVLPKWTEKFRKPGTQIVRQKDNFYLYKVERVFDEKSKRSKKKTTEYLGKITPEGVIPPKHKRNNSNLTDLDRNSKLLRNIEIIKQLKNGKDKTTLAKKYNVTLKTISNIEKKFKEFGLDGLIHTRKSKFEIVKVSTSEQAAIVTEFVKHPNKTAKEIKVTIAPKLKVSEIKNLISPIKKLLILKKKILLEII